jgi:anaerobic ribonucleoside-triphosphate reductase activating protein
MEGIEGITLSGGEPLLQDQDLMEFLHLVKTYTNLSVLIFSGLTLTEIKRRLKKNKTEAILDRVDILKTGRYRAGRPTKAPLRGSANQRLYFLTQRYTPDDLPPKAFEVIVRSSGERVITGFPPQRNFTD